LQFAAVRVAVVPPEEISTCPLTVVLEVKSWSGPPPSAWKSLGAASFQRMVEQGETHIRAFGNRTTLVPDGCRENAETAHG
jgi:hypothetical protein